MIGLGEFVLVSLLIYIIITWIIPWILRYIIRRCYHIEACIGRIGIPYLTLHDVHLTAAGFTIEIDQIGFRSSFLSSEVSKMLSVVIRDMRINKDVQQSSDNEYSASSWKPPETFQHLKIPPLLITIAQFVSIRVSSITCAVKRGECLAHSTLSSVYLEASVVHNARSLLVTVSLGSATTRLLRPSKKPSNEQPCLAHIHTTLALDATLVANVPLSVQSVSISLSSIKTVINDDFYSYFNLVQVKDRQPLSRGHGKADPEKRCLTNKQCDINSFLDYISPVIPKKLSMRLDDCIFTDNLDRDLTTLQKFYVDSTYTYLPHKSGIKCNASVQILVFGLDMKSETEKQFSLNKLSFDASLFEKRVSTSLTLNTCISTLDQNAINRLASFTNSTVGRSDASSSSGDVLRWWPDLEFDLRIVLTNISSLIKVPHLSKANVGFSHFKFAYDSHPQILDDMYESLVECLWCQLHHSKGCTISSLRKEHYWGSSFYIGFILVKGNTNKVDAKLDILRIEWSPPFAAILSLFIENVPNRLFKSKDNNRSRNKINFNMTLTNSNYFFMADNKVCLMLRMDGCKIERVSLQEKVICCSEGTKFCSISPTSNSFICHKSTDIKSWYGNFDIVKIEWREKQKLLKIKFSKEINFVWSPNLHLKIREVMMELMKFWKHVKYKDGPVEPVVVNKEKKLDLQIQLNLIGHIKVVVKLSQQHYITLVTDDFSYMISDSECIWNSTLMRLAIDSSDIFTLEQLYFTTLSDSQYIREERSNSDGFVLPWNRTWSVSMKSIKAVFPYEHAFSTAIQDEFVSIFKWLKKLHKKSTSSENSQLPPDLFIKIKEVVLEVSDDPFEVRLRDNYELLVDEYKESLMRQKKLEQKVSEMYKTHLLIPSGKLNELYTNLSRVNAQIYVQRSRRIQQQGTRTRLLAMILSDVQVLAMADPTLHNKHNVLNNMTNIDPSSPWPEEGLEFSTLWCRSIVAKCNELKFQLRDFPQPWVDIGQLNLWGRLVGAEQSPTRRAKRVVKLELGEPWGSTEIERSMTSLKFYHDFNMEVEHFSYAFGPCWEPVIAQCNISFEKIVRPSLDPSPPLPLWDKLRLILHGRLTAIIKQMTVLLHASLDPYNTTEEMEITWTNMALDWTSAKIIFKGNLDIYVRTASKYDDCRLLHLPNLKLSVKLGWECLGDPNDHHSVMPCAPDKLPDYSSNQEHDSFRAFRSQSLNISLALETKPASTNRADIGSPVALLYGSTLRWFENLKLILSGVTRPIRRGTVFGANVRPRKIPLSRHYRKVHLLLSLHSFQVHYWMSFAMQRGFELTAETISFSSEHLLSLVAIQDGLIHRNRAEWSVIYMTCELHNAEIWLRSALPQQEQDENLVTIRPTVEKCYFLSVGKVSYGREGSGPTHNHTLGPSIDSTSQPTHRLVVYGLKAAWTMSNRDVVFALYDTFMKTKQMKKNLCPESLKGFRSEGRNISGLKANRQTDTPASGSSAGQSNPNTSVQATPSPMSKLQCGHAATMLQQLIAEVDTKAVVFSDEPTTEPTHEQPLIGLAACQHTDDIAYNNWSIALVNSQVLLKGPETKGYVIISTEKAEILQRIHRPVWRDMTLVAKTTWVGSLQSVQYYATVNPDENDSLDENIMWLSVDNIREKDDCIISGLPDLPQLVGSGQSVGGVVSEIVGATSSDDHNSPLQLQRIVSRCTCEFFFASYGESSMSPSTLETVPVPPSEDSPSLWQPPKTPIDAFTLMHHDLDVCTNSLQYAMLLDIVNNLLLYVDVERKERYERLQRMRFQLQLQSVEDQRKPIIEAQTRVRSLLSQLRGLEKEMYLVQRALQDEPASLHLTKQIESLERQVNSCKETLNFQSEELDMMLSCYKETQLRADQKLAALRADKNISIVRANEICFKHAQWRLTEADGQLGIADLKLSNFLYTKNSKSDDSVEHLLEIGYVRMTNLLPNQVYREVLQPTEIHNNMPVDRKRAIRVFCREKAPVGGISIMEHFEINVVPLTIELTKKFYQTMLRFCFPERDADDEVDDDKKHGSSSIGTYSRGKDTNFYVPIERKDDVEKMKERAEKNKLFIYIKIPEVPVKVSYKGNKEKNLSDLRDLSLVIPTLEYHNVTWTWLDLLLAMKNDSKSVIVSQAIKHKLQIKSMRRGNDEGFPLEEDKARILFGTRHMPGESKATIKKSFFKFSK